ncbi:MAG TPA: type VI secretion system tube protein Hcp [Polyangiaceae bacterium]|nr:type VI secretion system tube protein Hcp [Polyangiaceae bacterium]
MPKKTNWKIVAAASAVVFAIPAAYAAITIGPDGVIHACADKKGMLRIVSSASSCSSNETPISWNQQGPAGVQGDKGDKGDTGDTGAQGDKGDKGDPGLPGDVEPDPVAVGTLEVNGETFPIFGFESSLTVPVTTSGGGSGSGKVQFSRVFVQRDAGAQTPLLNLDAARGKHYENVSIEVFTTPAADASLTVELEDVFIGSLSTTETPHAKTRETIGFDFTSIEWTIGIVHASFNRAQNTGGGGGDLEKFFLLDRGGSPSAFPSPAWSPALSFSTGIELPPPVFGGGGASKPSFDDLSIKRIADTATINHLANGCSGRHSRSTELDVTAPVDGQAEAFLRYGLESVLVTGVTLKTDAAGTLHETLSLNGGIVSWEYAPSGEPVETAGWDIAANQGI